MNYYLSSFCFAKKKQKGDPQSMTAPIEGNSFVRRVCMVISTFVILLLSSKFLPCFVPPHLFNALRYGSCITNHSIQMFNIKRTMPQRCGIPMNIVR